MLLVTHKTTNTIRTPANAIDAFTVGTNGLAALQPVRNASHGLRPFSLAFGHAGRLPRRGGRHSLLSAERVAEHGQDVPRHDPPEA